MPHRAGRVQGTWLEEASFDETAATFLLDPMMRRRSTAATFGRASTTSLRAPFVALVTVLLSATPALSAEGHAPSEAVFVAQFVMLLLVGRLFGEAMLRIGQPAVIGQLLAGIVLGPSIFGALLPSLQHWVFSPNPAQKAMTDGVAQLGILLLLLLTGMETDVALVRRAGRAALSVSVTGIAVPFVCGVAAGLFVLPDSLLPAPDHRLVTALFLGTALSISSIKIVAMVVREMNFMRRDLGQIIVASAIIDDTLGWIIIAITFGLARPDGLDPKAVGISVVGTFAFLALSYSVGRRAVSVVIRWANDHLKSEFPVITAILVVMGLMAIVTDAIGVHTVLGAFVAGVLIGESPILTRHIEGQLRGLVTAMFMPVFFALAGLGTDLSILRQPQLLMATVGLILVASLGKFGGAFMGGAIGGLSRRECLALALGMNARGSTEVIVATIGLSIGALNGPLFTVIVTMAVLTTMAMPPTLRWALARLPVGPEEEKRLEREAFERTDFVAGLERLLLATDGSASGRVAGRIVGIIGGIGGLPTTVVSVGAEDGPRLVDAEAESVKEAAIATRDMAGEEPDGTVDVIARTADAAAGSEAAGLGAEASKGYDLVVVGREPAEEQGGGFSAALVETLCELEPARAVVVARGVLADRPTDGPLRILVPVTGSQASRKAAEFAFALARPRDATVTVLYVTSPRERQDASSGTFAPGKDSSALARSIFEDIAERAVQRDVRLRTRVRISEAPAQAILRQMRRSVHTLLILGVSQRPSDAVLFGSTANAILERCEQTVVFLAAEPRTREDAKAVSPETRAMAG